MESRRILIVASEVAPLAATGELAFTVQAYARALRRRGHDVRIAMPGYRQITDGTFRKDFSLRLGGRNHSCILKEKPLDFSAEGAETVPVYLLGNHEYFHRTELYGEAGGSYPDNGERFGFFSRAVLTMLPEINFQPQVIHLFDWQSAMVALFLRNHLREEPFFKPIRCLFTIHNLQYQGTCDTSILGRMDLGWEYFVPSRLEFFWKVNFLKAGLIYADQLATVSESYAAEIQTRQYGEGLEGLLRSRKEFLTGINNGLDASEWDPGRDRHLAATYNAENLAGKANCRHALLKEFNLQITDKPVVCMVSRLVEHKGVDLILQILPRLLQEDRIRFVALGVGEPRYHQALIEIQQQFPERMGLSLTFNPTLMRRVMAGSDISVFPAKTEPSGIGHRISVRYGTVPVVRLTGGLKDGVKSCQTNCVRDLMPLTFQESLPDLFASSLEAALELQQKDPPGWQDLVRCLMQHDFSWDVACLGYEQLIDKMLTPAEGNI